MAGAFVLGSAMGAMMLAMLHAPVMSGEMTGSLAFAGFVRGHLALVVAAGVMLLLIPSLRQRVLRHRPNLGHAAMMLAGALSTIMAVHLWTHGVAA